MKYVQNFSNIVKYEKCKGKGPCKAHLNSTNSRFYTLMFPTEIPTINFIILYHFYDSKECLCKIFQNFILGKGLIFALKVWDFSKKQEQASAHEGN